MVAGVRREVAKEMRQLGVRKNTRLVPLEPKWLRLMTMTMMMMMMMSMVSMGVMVMVMDEDDDGPFPWKPW